jgi:hypothetical protein
MTPLSLNEVTSNVNNNNQTSWFTWLSNWFNERFRAQPVQKPRLGRKLLVLDLDETLIHATTRSSLFTPFAHRLAPVLRIEVSVLNHPVLYYVYTRPHLITFMSTVSQWYDLAIYTASVKEYADPIIDYLAKVSKVPIPLKQRFYRHDCTPVDMSVYQSIGMQGVEGRTQALGHPYGSHPYFKDLRNVISRWRGGWRRRKLHNSQQQSQQYRRVRLNSLTSDEIGLHAGVSSDRSFMESNDEASSSTVSTAMSMPADYLDLLLSKTILLDNSPVSFFPQPRNGLPVLGWLNDETDETLLDVLPVLDALRYVDDVRHVLSFRRLDLSR